MEQFFEIFTLVTGVIYVVLEILQKNFMWVVGILTSVAAMWVFYSQGLYASFGLNTYYLITAVIGLWQWRKYKGELVGKSVVEAAIETSGSVDSDGQDGETGAERRDGDVIHLNKLTFRVLLMSLLLAVVGVFALAKIMELTKLMEIPENPLPYLDSTATVLSVVATWWLVKSYPQQWLLWIVADGLSIGLCAYRGLWWMTALYAVYALAAIYGYWHWIRKGTYI